MIRLLNQTEMDIIRAAWPSVFLPAQEIPPDGLLRYIDDVGCVFAFQKTNGERLYILASDIWTDCSRQELPAPQGFWDEIVNEMLKFVPTGETIRLMLYLILGGIALVLLKREGFLN